MKTILIIEDDETIRNNLLEILELEGFRGIGAEHGQLGISKAKAFLPDLILCDICMPELDGYGVLSALRCHPQTATIPLIFLTAKSERQEMRRGMNLGADDYLIKPCSVAELLAAISSRLEKHLALTQCYAHQQRETVEAIKQEAFLDPLTHLPTRKALHQRLQYILMHSTELTTIAVLCINLQRFHTINASFGHSIGDIVLQLVARRLTKIMQSQAKFPGESRGLLARLNGDQFGIVITHASKSELCTLAQTILDTIAAPYLVNGADLRLHANIGIVHVSNPNCAAQALITQAETAQHWSQQRSTNDYQFYSPELDKLEVERRLIEMDLSNAIDRSEFQVHYQPQIELTTGRIIGMEALLRWTRPMRDPIPPNTFIPIAEELGLIVPLGEWVLRTACHHAKQWQELSAEPLRVSVNLSMRQLQQENLLDRVSSILAETGLDPTRLVLELTESCLMRDVDATVGTLHRLKQLGIEISIDDFGTGYSSLNYLYQLPIDSLKIDRSFVQQSSEGSTTIANAIIDMAKGLNLQIVAEGIETESQLTFFRDRGCHAMQGYLYSPPVSAEKMRALLISDRRLPLTVQHSRQNPRI